MRAFEVYVNGKRLCLAGIGDDGVLNVSLNHVVGNGWNDLSLRVGGLNCLTREHVLWRRRQLKTGDEVRVKIVKADSVDRPKQTKPVKPQGQNRS